MAGYSAYVPANAGGGIASERSALERAVLVPERFHWSALFFAPLWLLSKRLWWPLLAYLAAMVVIALLVWAVPGLQPLAPLMTLALNLLVAFEAPRLEALGLQRRGYAPAGPVEAPDAEAAEARFFERALAKPTPEVPRAPLVPLAPGPASAPRDGAPGIVGLFPTREGP